MFKHGFQKSIAAVLGLAVVSSSLLFGLPSQAQNPTAPREGMSRREGEGMRKRGQMRKRGEGMRKRGEGMRKRGEGMRQRSEKRD